MDDIIYYFYQNGFYVVAALAVVKMIIIFLYKGLDFGYMFENFLIIYSDTGIGATPQRVRFRRIHNIATAVFYLALVIWLAIVGVVHLAR
ncbi:MAG TPA: hypothetical protein VF145_12645 [Chitinophagaceae bacterium]